MNSNESNVTVRTTQSARTFNRCKYGVIKQCQVCNERYLAIKWCGELMCQPCLEMAWLIDDDDIVELLFNCCPSHRPLVMDILIEDHPCQITEPSEMPALPVLPRSEPIPIMESGSSGDSEVVKQKKLSSFVQSFQDLIFKNKAVQNEREVH